MLGLGNKAVSGDPYSLKQYGKDVLLAGITGGVVSGVSSALGGKNFWTGKAILGTSNLSIPSRDKLFTDWGKRWTKTKDGWKLSSVSVGSTDGAGNAYGFGEDMVGSWLDDDGNVTKSFPAPIPKTAGGTVANNKYAFGFGKNAIKLANDVGGRHLMRESNWKDSFTKIINDSESEIHFSLDGVDQTPMNMINSPTRSSTNWEMNQLYQSPAFERTIFHHEGNIYKGFEVFKLKP